MRTRILLQMFACGVLISQSAYSGIILTNTDAWDVSQGNTVTSDTGTLSGFPINNMFGGGGSIEAETLFRDFQPAGTLHAVEWQTPSPVTVRSILLDIAHDQSPRDANARGISRLTLYAYNAGTSSFDIKLFELFPDNPYASTVAPANSLIEVIGSSDVNRIRLATNIVPTTAQRFRGEFVQFGTFGGNANGPRVFEIDAYDTFYSGLPVPSSSAVPEPSSLALLATGAFGLFGYGWLRKRKQAP